MKKKLEDYMDWPLIEDLIYAECDDVSEVLGAKEVDGDVVLQAYFPKAKSVTAVFNTRRKPRELEKMDQAGYFAGFVGSKKIPEYRFKVEYENETVEVPDSYMIDEYFDAMDAVMFNDGEYDKVYEKMGSHVIEVDGVKGTVFDVWAPNALSCSVVGDFNDWDGKINPMRRTFGGVFELFIPGVEEGEKYKYEIHGKKGEVELKTDPYAYKYEKGYDACGIVCEIEGYTWNDSKYMKNRTKTNEKPMFIYEVHPASFQKPEYRDDEVKAYNYAALGTVLGEYCKKMGYTHVKMMSIQEFFDDATCGYVTSGFYAPTIRYGEPQDFMKFVDTMHGYGIGVILDINISEFSMENGGLKRFDFTALYEHLNDVQGMNKNHGTMLFNYQRSEVKNFLVSSGVFWMEKYHVDGFYLNSVSSMLYLDYDKDEYLPNMYGGNENLDAIEFLKHYNGKIHEVNEYALTFAQEEAAFSDVTLSVQEGGLGFDYKYNKSFASDYIDYIRTDPLFRKGKHDELTGSMLYNYSERFAIGFSHDFLTMGAGSMYNKMPGTSEQKMNQIRLTYGYMCAHPGAKLLFMGQDFAQEREWDMNRGLDWGLLDDMFATSSETGKIVAIKSPNKLIKDYVKDLISFYKGNTAMYKNDYSTEGFSWVVDYDANRSIISFMRESGEQSFFVICNFTPVRYEKCEIPVSKKGKYKEVFNSDEMKYGGSGTVNSRMITSKKKKIDGFDDMIVMDVAPFAIQIFEIS